MRPAPPAKIVFDDASDASSYGPLISRDGRCEVWVQTMFDDDQSDIDAFLSGSNPKGWAKLEKPHAHAILRGQYDGHLTGFVYVGQVAGLRGTRVWTRAIG
jgi:hypothetical protein